MKKRPKMILAAAGVIASAAFYVFSGEGAELNRKTPVPDEEVGAVFMEAETFSESQKEEIRTIVTECLSEKRKEEVTDTVREVLSEAVQEMVENGTLSEGLKNCAEKEAGLVNVNTAQKEELKTLSGIGDVKAENILRYRSENGAFTTVEELLFVDGISASLLEKIRPYITV